MHEIMENPEKEWNSCHSQKAFREATSRHRSMNRKRNEETPPTAPTDSPNKTPRESENEATTLRTTTTERMLRCAETAGKPGIRTREWHCSWTKTRKG
ncbi:hypothetical protein EVAR_11025_1 [Eumeta japonica]|uniref:Uncharacterized protein n=1 Tax=Eumeta variegata TaxID=151549 RepID=A0A4C1U3M7_EUMVA|nr:hypothetical protein EVAR_11025_1 [Eumeta japonica]